MLLYCKWWLGKLNRVGCLSCLLGKASELCESGCGVLAQKESCICFIFLRQLDRFGKQLFLRTLYVFQIALCYYERVDFSCSRQKIVLSVDLPRMLNRNTVNLVHKCNSCCSLPPTEKTLIS